jgi:hypothetical protein
MNERDLLLDWDKIMKTIRERDCAKEEMAFRRYRGFIRQSGAGQLKWAASDTPEMEGIRQRIGAELGNRCPINLKLYSAELYVLDRDSALLTFKKADKLASDLDGKTVDFFLIEQPSSFFSETIQEGEVVIKFQKLGLSIEEYAKVALRLHVDDSTVIEERLGTDT